MGLWSASLIYLDYTGPVQAIERTLKSVLYKTSCLPPAHVKNLECNLPVLVHHKTWRQFSTTRESLKHLKVHDARRHEPPLVCSYPKGEVLAVSELPVAADTMPGGHACLSVAWHHQRQRSHQPVSQRHGSGSGCAAAGTGPWHHPVLTGDVMPLSRSFLQTRGCQPLCWVLLMQVLHRGSPPRLVPTACAQRLIQRWCGFTAAKVDMWLGPRWI